MLWGLNLAWRTDFLWRLLMQHAEAHSPGIFYMQFQCRVSVLFFQPFLRCHSRGDLWRSSWMGTEYGNRAILVPANTNSSHMLNYLPEKIRLALAITPCRSVYWKNRKGKPPRRGSAPGWTSVGQMLKTDLPQHTTARRTKVHLLCRCNTAWWNSHAICCLLFSDWNKIGERVGFFKLSYWRTCLF